VWTKAFTSALVEANWVEVLLVLGLMSVGGAVLRGSLVGILGSFVGGAMVACWRACLSVARKQNESDEPQALEDGRQKNSDMPPPHEIDQKVNLKNLHTNSIINRGAFTQSVVKKDILTKNYSWCVSRISWFAPRIAPPTLCQTIADDMVVVVLFHLHKSYQCEQQ
jgi:hypothetical protein